jgi:hypothetical protein
MLYLATLGLLSFQQLNFELYRQKLLAGKQKENSKIFNEDFYLPLYLPLCLGLSVCLDTSTRNNVLLFQPEHAWIHACMHHLFGSVVEP